MVDLHSLSPTTLIRLSWGDAWSPVGRVWLDPEEVVERNKPMPMVTVGYLVHVSKESVAIADTWSGEGSLSGLTVVPLGWITKVEVLRKPGK